MVEAEPLRAHLLALAVMVDAQVAALFVPNEAGRLRLASSTTVDQAVLDTIELAWTTRRPEVLLGQVLRLEGGVVWPLLRADQLMGVVYLDRAGRGFPSARMREQADRLADRMGRQPVEPPAALRPFVEGETLPQRRRRLATATGPRRPLRTTP